jgi:hypothetical protein
MIFGIINLVIGGIFLSLSGVSVIASASFTHDIAQESCDSTGCRPMQDFFMDAAIATGIFGGIDTALGLFLLMYGMKQQKSRPAKPVT